MSLVLVMEEDPVCDAVQNICGSCHYKHKCEYLDNGQVSSCATVKAELDEEYPMEMQMNNRLERCFDQLIGDKRKRGVRW
jgi:hypothetical protein